MFKKLFKWLIVSTIVASSLVSCASTAKSYDYVSHSYAPYVTVDLDLTGKIEATRTTRTYFGFITFGKPKHFAETPEANGAGYSITKLKSAAIYDAIKTAQVDEIVNPMFTIKRKVSFLGIKRTCEVHVVGYGAKKGEVTVVN